jgi:hypothetical protein
MIGTINPYFLWVVSVAPKRCLTDILFGSSKSMQKPFGQPKNMIADKYQVLSAPQEHPSGGSGLYLSPT